MIDHLIMLAVGVVKALPSIKHTASNAIESCDYAPVLCMLALGKSGEGAYMQDPNISV